MEVRVGPTEGHAEDVWKLLTMHALVQLKQCLKNVIRYFDVIALSVFVRKFYDYCNIRAQQKILNDSQFNNKPNTHRSIIGANRVMSKHIEVGLSVGLRLVVGEAYHRGEGAGVAERVQDDVTIRLHAPPLRVCLAGCVAATSEQV